MGDLDPGRRRNFGRRVGRKLKKIGPYRVTRTMGSTVSAVLATAFKLQGLSYSVSSACSTGAHSIGMGMEQIQLGKHDVMFCGSGELENWCSTIMFDGMGALSSKYNDDPTHASRAFDKDRDGFVIAAGRRRHRRGARAREGAGCQDLRRASRLFGDVRRLRHGRAVRRGRQARHAGGHRHGQSVGRREEGRLH